MSRTSSGTSAQRIVLALASSSHFLIKQLIDCHTEQQGQRCSQPQPDTAFPTLDIAQEGIMAFREGRHLVEIQSA